MESRAKAIRLQELIYTKVCIRELTESELFEYCELLHFIFSQRQEILKRRTLWGKQVTEEEYQKEVSDPFWDYNRK